MVERGRIEEGLVWLRQALVLGNLNFLRVASQALGQAPQPQVRALAQEYALRRIQLEQLQA